MSAERIDFIISPDGDSIDIGVKGMQGGDCLEKSKRIEKMLGNIQENTRNLTEEYYDAEVALTVENGIS